MKLCVVSWAREVNVVKSIKRKLASCEKQFIIGRRRASNRVNRRKSLFFVNFAKGISNL